MTKIDPIIAVKDVNVSAEWYQAVFGCKRSHGGNDFAVLKDKNEEILFCLLLMYKSQGKRLYIYTELRGYFFIFKIMIKISYSFNKDIYIGIVRV